MHPDAPWLRSISSGLTLPPACRAWRCDHCGPRKATRTGAAVDAAGYTRWVTLTNAPADARQGAARAAHLFRRAVGGFEWIWTLERGQKTGMVHLHGMVRSKYLPQRQLSELAAQAGWGRNVWIAAGVNTAGGYAAKCAGYAAKGFESYPEWRALNGGARPWHWSRGYTAGTPMREWVAVNAPAKDPGPWRIVNAREIDGYADRVAAWLDATESYAREGFDVRRDKLEHLQRESDGIALVRLELGAWDFERAALDDRPLATSDRVIQSHRS